MEATENKVLLGRGNLTGTGGAAAAPGSGATVVLYDSTAVGWRGLYEDGLPYNRIAISLVSSHNSAAGGVVPSVSLDRGVNWEADGAAQLYTATALATYDTLTQGGHVRVLYTNSANVLTAWRYEVFGIYDRNPGV